MAAQLWDITLLSSVVSVVGAGNTASQAADSGAGPYSSQAWDIQYWDGTTYATGIGNTTSVGLGSATAENANWYTISGTVNEGAAGAGSTLSQAVDSGVSTKNPTAVDGIGNTLSQAADYAPLTIISPPSVTGFGDTISSSYGWVLRSFNTLGAETRGEFDVNQHTTGSSLIRPTANGDFIIDGLPLPS